MRNRRLSAFRPAILLAVSLMMIGCSSIRPVVWKPGTPAPMTGALAPNDRLREGERIGEGRLWSPEDVAFDSQGRLYAGSRDRDAQGDADVNPRIERVTFAPNGNHSAEVFVELPGGGPLDMRFDAAGNLVVASWRQGLLSISPDGAISTLVREGDVIDGKKFGWPDGIAIGASGRIYFTQGTDEGRPANPVHDVLENRNRGRLLVYDPSDRSVRVLFDQLSFGNGVAVAPDESWVLVADQYRYRIHWIWLSGPKAGQAELFSDSLPGFVHNLFLDADGILWVAIYTGRSGMGDRFAGSPFMKRLLASLPSAMLRGGEVDRDETLRGEGMIVAMDLQGNYLASWQNPPRALNTLSAGVPHGDHLYVGALRGGPVIRVPIDRAALQAMMTAAVEPSVP